MLDIGVYNSLICRVTSGPLNQESLEMMIGKEHPCIDFLQNSPDDYYALNNFVSVEVPSLSQGGRILLPKNFPCIFYGSQELVETLEEDEEVIVIGILNYELRMNVHEPWVMFSMDSGRQGEFSLNILMRDYERMKTSEE